MSLSKEISNKQEVSPLDELKDLVSDDMSRVDALIWQLVKNKIELIPDISNHVISAGGKRLRPMLTLIFSNLFSYQGEDHIGLAAAVEFMHTATLLHDDVVDDSKLRRGSKTANNVWGNKESILVGDFLLGKAFHLMVEPKSIRVMQILSNAAMVISEGEVMQLAAKNNIAAAKNNYFEIIESKTAKLFSAACEIAAVISGKEDEVQAAAMSYGLNLGISFQIVDDVLDYVLNNKAVGKNIGDDFREGKVTLPVLLAYEQADKQEKEFFVQVFEQHKQADGDLQKAIELINKHGAIAKSLDVAREYVAKAKSSLELISVDNEYKQLLLKLADFTVDRYF